MCDIVNGSIGGVDEEEAKVRKQVLKEVLAMKFNALPRSRIIRVLDENPNTVIELALQHGFSKDTVDDMSDKQFGGGQPHVRFVELLLSKNFSIDYVKDAMIKAGISENSVNDNFYIAEEKHYYYFNEFTPREVMPFFKLVREDIYNCDQPCWKHVAEQLGMDDVISFISSTRVQGGMYSIGSAFCTIISGQNPSIEEFKEDLDNELNKMREDGASDSTIIVEKICNMYVKAIEDKVQIRLRAIKEKTRRTNRR